MVPVDVQRAIATKQTVLHHLEKNNFVKVHINFSPLRGEI
jgi:hypothetical protein